MVRRGEVIDKETRENIAVITGYNDFETASSSEYLDKLTKHLAQLEHSLVSEQKISMPGAPASIPQNRSVLLKQHLDQLLKSIDLVIYDIYGTNVDDDFIEKQIMPRVLKTVSRWVGSWITERVPSGMKPKS